MAIRMGELLEVGGEELKKLFPEKTERLKLLLRTRLHSDAEGAGSAELAEILAARVAEVGLPVCCSADE